ncbi:hypothetical protein BD413DRAFT_231953 [Trametes elegans]|nr:hypothetical protein BD413DRAFT_231953 [Trametes elegans]
MSTSLIPGYKHVETFGDDDEYEQVDGEVEEEVEYVTLDLGTVEPTLVPSSSSYRIIGLDTPTPYLQLSGTKLKGQHQSLLGTELLFTEGGDEQQPHHAQGKKPLVHVATTGRRIRFKEVELRPKGAGAAPDAPPASTSKASTVAKKVKTQMDHVMGTPSGSSRRGRGGKKRGGTTKAQAKGKARAATEAPQQEVEMTVDDDQQPLQESQLEPEPEIDPELQAEGDPVIDPALTRMDTSEG